MKIQDKKLSMADKMYDQNSKGGVGSNPKNYQTGKAKGNLSMKYEMAGKDTGYAKGQKYSQSDKKGSFKVDNYQALPNASMKGGYKM